MKKFFIALVLLALPLYFYRQELVSFFKQEEKKEELDASFEVKRGDFQITLTLDGTLNPIKKYNLAPEVTSRNPYEITFLVANNTHVKKGDLVCEFSDETYQSQLETYEIELENELKNLEVGEEELEALQFNNLANIKKSVVAYSQSQDMLLRYRDEDSLNDKKKLIADVSKADQSLEQAEEALSEAKKELNSNQDKNLQRQLEKELRDKEKALTAAETARKQSFYNLRIFKRYTYSEKLDRREEDVNKNKLGLQNEIIRSKSQVLKSQKNMAYVKKRIKKAQEDIKRVKKILVSLKLYAEVDGVFSLAPPRRHGQNSEEYAVGSQIRYGQILGTIPDMSRFLVNTKVPEAYRSYVERDLVCELRIKSIPDLKIQGKISEIATLAVRDRNWDESSPKRYPMKIATEVSDDRLTPGITVDVEVILDKVKDVLFVPIEAVFNRDGTSLVQLRNSQAKLVEREVKTGKTSMDFVEITEGLKAGDEVILNKEFND